MSKFKKTTNLICSLMFFGVALGSISLTVKFIKPPESEEKVEIQKEENIKVEQDKNETMQGNYPGNLIQHYVDGPYTGMVASNNKYVFKYQLMNGNPCLTRTDIKTGESKIAFTGYEVRNLSIIKNNLYMIVTQRVKDVTYDVLGYMDVEKMTFNPMNETKNDNINSFVSDGKNLYYSVEENNSIFKVNKDGVVSEIYKSDSTAEPATLIGINEGKIYYVNGKSLCSLGIHSKENIVLSNQYNSTNQYPIITKEGIFCFYNLSHTRLDELNLDGSFKRTIYDHSQSKEIQSRIDSMNYSCGYIFLLAGNDVFYLDKTDFSVKKLEEAKPLTSQMYFTDEYIILESDKYGKPIITNISWLLAS